MHNGTNTRQQEEGESRSSLDKPPILTPDPAFDRLPDEIIQQILQLTDPGSFASLILLNSKWRSVSQQAQLYALHLSRCQCYSSTHPPLREADVKDEDLPRLRRLFAREVKRNLFEAYLRPRETVIKLISNSISSSSCPGGEGMQFSPSPRGHHVLAYNSSRIYVLDVRGKTIDVKREFKILRRPVSTCIKDDGSVLAVLSSEMQVDLYDLEQSPPRRTQSLILDNPPRTIALSPCGSVLAAAYEGGIEVSLVNPGALPTDRRAVKCDGVDALSFSFDGTQILGTTIHSSPPATVILTAPYYDPGNQMADDSISALWTTSILFPNTSRDCSHAVLLQDSGQEEASWTFTYDRSFETFRAVRIDDLRNGTTYFTGPKPDPGSQGKLTPCTLPAATFHGDLVSAGFQGKDVWLYGVPEDLDAAPEVNAPGADGLSALAGQGRRSSGPPSRSSSSRAQENPRVPQWQVLCDKLRNTFVWGAKVAELDGVSTVKWVGGFGETSAQERLVVAARGISPGKSIIEEDDIDFIDGGRVTLLDFDYSLDDGQRIEIEIEVGTRKPEILEEEQRDIDAEVAIVRRRTVAQRRGDRGALMRAATNAAVRGNPLPPMPSMPPMPPMPQPKEEPEARNEDDDDDDDDPLVPRRIGAPPQINVQESISSSAPQAGRTASMMEEEEEEAVEAPYAHDGPRSTNTLRRAATAAAINRSRNPQAPAAGPVEYRRADGRREHPHESDADNWVPPPPPYQKDDPGDLPAFLRNAVITPGGVQIQSQPARIQTAAPAVGASAWPLPERPTLGQTPGRPLSYHEPVTSPPANATHHLRIASDSTTLLSRPRTADSSSPTFSPPADVDDNDDIYDVSPPETPCVAASRPNDADAISPEGQRMAGESLAVQAPNNDALQDSQAVTPEDSSVTLAALQAQPPPSLGLQIPSGSSPNAAALGQPHPASAVDVPLGSWAPCHRPLPGRSNCGVTGAYDAPMRQQSNRRNEMPLLAPVPRHPRPTQSGPHVERLETIYSDNTNAEAYGSRSLIPAWLQTPSTPSAAGRQSHSSVNRRPSRAERSAAKNIKDAKRRGWNGSKKKKKNKKVDHEVASSAVWTDVSAAGGNGTHGKSEKDKKCVIM
ncbi:F-box domain-containing protein [Colletotrichum cereale]|nr:F-box domain-containing protein [Colletotrichum cereale]